jgi:hypothetical protein
MVEADLAAVDVRLRSRYRRIAVLLLVIAIIFTVWTIAVVLSIFMFGVSNGLTFLTPTEWVIANIIVVALFLAIDGLIFLRYRNKTRGLAPQAAPQARRWRRGRKEPVAAPEMIHGHEVFTVTLPLGAMGGIFSKTFVPIDDQRVLQLRFQMIPPTTLWPPQQE